MGKFVFLVVLVAAMVFSSAYGQGLEVIEMQGDHSLVVLLDQDTGEEYAAAAGDVIAGWRVEKIAQNYVTISRPADDGMLLITRIPVQARPGATPRE